MQYKYVWFESLTPRKDKPSEGMEHRELVALFASSKKQYPKHDIEVQRPPHSFIGFSVANFGVVFTLLFLLCSGQEESVTSVPNAPTQIRISVPIEDAVESKDSREGSNCMDMKGSLALNWSKVVALLISRVALPKPILVITSEPRKEPSSKPMRTTPSSHSIWSVFFGAIASISSFDRMADMIPSQILVPHFDLEKNMTQVIGTSTFSRPGIWAESNPFHWYFASESFEESVIGEDKSITVGGACDGRIDSFKFDATR
mmetsp:Transcript_21493/g.51939  ORF Transcript_21493/g.51939 Transcript_21493/m.51939 type:complete len:259 (-) Transcript_21493:685-1461(-)